MVRTRFDVMTVVCLVILFAVATGSAIAQVPMGGHGGGGGGGAAGQLPFEQAFTSQANSSNLDITHNLNTARAEVQCRAAGALVAVTVPEANRTANALRVTFPGSGGPWTGFCRVLGGGPGPVGTGGSNGASAYVYFAYADDASGTGFTTTFNASKQYFAAKSSTTVIASPAASDFTGLWFKWKGETGPAGSGSGDMLVAQNLADLANPATARENIGLGNVATRDVGTTAGTAAAGDDSRIVNAVQPNSSPTLANLNAASVTTNATGPGFFGAFRPHTSAVAGDCALGLQGAGATELGCFDGEGYYKKPSITSKAAVFNSSGRLVGASGTASDCVKVDGSSGPCGAGSSLPSQTGNAGKILLTDGTNALWKALEGGPSGAIICNFSTTPATCDLVPGVVPLLAGANPLEGLTTFNLGYMDVKRVAAPVNPSTGYLRLYSDETSGDLKCKDASGGDCLPVATGGDASTNTSTSVDGEVALFSSTGGKTLKRATGSGYAKLTSGVLSAGSIAAADLPNPGASSKGGVMSKACSGTDKISTIGTDGIPVCTADSGGTVAEISGSIQLPIGCTSGSSGTIGAWGIPSSAGAAPNCDANSRAGVLQYADTAGGLSARALIRLPSTFVSGTTATLRFGSMTGTAGSSVTTTARSYCIGDGDSVTPTWNTAQTLAFTPTTTPTLRTISAIDLTGCAAGEMLLIELARDTTDTSTSTLSVFGAEAVVTVAAPLVTESRTFTLPDPVAGDSGNYTVFIPVAATITRVTAFTRGGTGTVTLNLDKRAETTPGTTGTSVLSADLVADATQTSCASGCDVNTITSASVSARTWLTLTISAVASAPTGVTVAIEYTR